MTYIDCHVDMSASTVENISSWSQSTVSSAYKMMGPSAGMFSEPNTSMSLKNEHIAELASATRGLWVNPNGIAKHLCYVARV